MVKEAVTFFHISDKSAAKALGDLCKMNQLTDNKGRRHFPIKLSFVSKCCPVNKMMEVSCFHIIINKECFKGNKRTIEI